MTKVALISKKPQRLFTFGCSFTGFKYPTWAEILAYDLGIPFYNYGRSGAGNPYMFNMLMQADNDFQFTADDLIIICWTNFAREDRFKQGVWHTPGNIYTQRIYGKEWVRDWADEQGFALRDSAIIKAAHELLRLRGSTFHFISMLNLFENVNQWEPNTNSDLQQIQHSYREYVGKILPSFYEVLWNNNIQNKIAQEQSIHPRLKNGHPTPKEHLHYLSQVFDHEFRPETVHTVDICEQQYQTIVQTSIKRTSFDFMDFSPCWFTKSNLAASLLTKDQ